MKHTIITIPNVLSFVRLCLVPFIAVTYTKGFYSVAALLLVLSGFTDMLDGFIARHLGQISEFGKFIDPFADKLTIAAVVFALLLRHPQLWVTMSVIIIKEGLSLIAAYILYKRGTRPSESKLFGKLSTLMLYFVAFVIMVTDIVEAYQNSVLLQPWMIWAMVGLTCLFMICATVQYYSIYIGIRHGTYNIKTEQFEGDSNDT